MIVIATGEHAEALLRAGQLSCPGCVGALRPHGHGATRTVRGLGDSRVTPRPRRARCTSCAATHVLLPAELVPRRADTVEVIGTALAAQVRGDGHRVIAARLGRPVSTVRRWLRRARGPHVGWLREQGVQHAYRADPDILNRRLVWPTVLGDKRPGNAGSFTADDHVKVLDAALVQIPVAHRGDLLVTIDTAGASHQVVEHLTRWNTVCEHGWRGRRVEYPDRLAGR